MAAVAESAAIGVPDELKGEVILCFAVLKAGHWRARRCEMSFAIGWHWRSASRLRRRMFGSSTELPKTRSGKIVRRVIRKVAIGQEPGDLSSIENLGALEAVRRAVRG